MKFFAGVLLGSLGAFFLLATLGNVGVPSKEQQCLTTQEVDSSCLAIIAYNAGIISLVEARKEYFRDRPPTQQAQDTVFLSIEGSKYVVNGYALERYNTCQEIVLGSLRVLHTKCLPASDAVNGDYGP